MRKVLIVATVVKTHIMEFHIPCLKMFKEMGWETSVVARNDYENPQDCVVPYCDIYYDIPFERSPLKAKNFFAYKQLKKIINAGKYDIIHCHTPVGAFLTRLAARKARQRGSKVIYTAHGFHFYKGAPIKNWLLYYPAEWLCAHWTDVLITINREDYALAQRKMRAGKVKYVPGVGIDLSRFENVNVNRSEKRKQIGIPENAMLLLSVGELNENKNHETVIRALASLDNVYYVIAGQGGLRDRLQSVIDELGMSSRVQLLGYRKDVSELYAAADVFVMPSFREGLSVALMEAMASGLPCVVSKIRGNIDLIDEDGGVLFNPYSVEDCGEAIRQALDMDPQVAGVYNRDKVSRFSQATVLEKMSEIYMV